jgi:small-conductance mechanosensitive channel
MAELLQNIKKGSSKLSSVKTSSPFFYLLLLPPVYLFWSINLINLTFNRGKNLMIFFTLVMLLISFLLIGAYGYGLLEQSLFIKTKEFKTFVSCYTILWCLFYFVTSLKSLRFEVEKGISTPKAIDLFVRFFVLSNWYIGIWSFQPVIQQYK